MHSVRRRISLGLVVSVSAGLGLGFQASLVPAGEPQGVSLIQLIANPAAYDGVAVRAIGFCWLEHEGNGLFVHQDDFEHGVFRNALWLDLGWPEPEEYRQLSGQYVLVEATFRAAGHGHGGLYSGELTNIRRIVVWPSRKQIERPSKR